MSRGALIILFLFLAAGQAFSQGTARFSRIRLVEDSVSAGKKTLLVELQNHKHSRLCSRCAYGAWPVMDRTVVAYSGDEGVGGFENEGQSLHLVTTGGQVRKVLAGYFIIDSVWSVRLSSKKWTLLVILSDGGLGAQRFAVVDPARGEVFFRALCRVQKVAGDFVELAFYTAEDWGRLTENSQAESKGVKPIKTERVDLKKALAGKVIVNKHDPAY